jgi:hypothetical protein
VLGAWLGGGGADGCRMNGIGAGCHPQTCYINFIVAVTWVWSQRN